VETSRKEPRNDDSAGEPVSRWRVCCGAAIVAAAMLAAPLTGAVSRRSALVSTDTTRADPVPRAALDAILGTFRTHQVVLLGEIHWSVAQHRFIRRLLRDPRLPRTIDDIAVEFANARYQPLIDRYVAGSEVPTDSLALVWQDAIVPLAWDASVYPAFFRAVRTVNARLPKTRRLRVIALDPPIQWDSVRTAADIPRRWGYRDPVWFEILDREVIAKGHKALVIAGGLHVIRRDPVSSFREASLDRAGLGDAFAQRYAGLAYSAYPVVGERGVGSLVKHWRPNMLAPVSGTTLGARSSHLLMPGNLTVFTMVDGKRVPRVLEEKDYPPIDQLIDAVVYYGPDTLLAPVELAPYRDSVRVAELRRRSTVMQAVFGQDLDAQIDSLVGLACRKRRSTCGKM
jgi:hypothetical protein